MKSSSYVQAFCPICLNKGGYVEPSKAPILNRLSNILQAVYKYDRSGTFEAKVSKCRGCHTVALVRSQVKLMNLLENLIPSVEKELRNKGVFAMLASMEMFEKRQSL